jgi:hypothetical protein
MVQVTPLTVRQAASLQSSPAQEPLFMEAFEMVTVAQSSEEPTP